MRLYFRRVATTDSTGLENFKDDPGMHRETGARFSPRLTTVCTRSHLCARFAKSRESARRKLERRRLVREKVSRSRVLRGAGTAAGKHEGNARAKEPVQRGKVNREEPTSCLFDTRAGPYPINDRAQWTHERWRTRIPAALSFRPRGSSCFPPVFCLYTVNCARFDFVRVFPRQSTPGLVLSLSLSLLSFLLLENGQRRAVGDAHGCKRQPISSRRSRKNGPLSLDKELGCLAKSR